MRAKLQIASAPDRLPDRAQVRLAAIEDFQARLARVEGGIGTRGIKLQRRKAELDVFEGALGGEVGIDVDIGRVAVACIDIGVGRAAARAVGRRARRMPACRPPYLGCGYRARGARSGKDWRR
jgi:hypothetical protein